MSNDDEKAHDTEPTWACPVVSQLKANAPAFDITLKEYTLKDSLKNIATDLLRSQPKIIGFSVYIWNVEKTLTLINLLKEKDPILITFLMIFRANCHPAKVRYLKADIIIG